jgi:hypothetical protein
MRGSLPPYKLVPSLLQLVQVRLSQNQACWCALRAVSFWHTEEYAPCGFLTTFRLENFHLGLLEPCCAVAGAAAVWVGRGDIPYYRKVDSNDKGWIILTETRKGAGGRQRPLGLKSCFRYPIHSLGQWLVVESERKKCQLPETCLWSSIHEEAEAFCRTGDFRKSVSLTGSLATSDPSSISGLFYDSAGRSRQIS